MDEVLVKFMDSLESEDSLELSRKVLMPNYGVPALCFVRGNGAWLYDAAGRPYLDFLSGIAVTSLGHANPKVAEAVSRQAEKLVHVSNLFATEVGPKVAAAIDFLIRIHNADAEGGQVFFANSGAEANEAAIKLARRFGFSSKRHHIISALGSFHGRTMGALSATAQRSKQIPFEPLVPGFSHVQWNDAEAIEASITPSTVAVILEPIQGEAGVIDPGEDYLLQVRRICDDRDLLLIMDEVQTGFGRTGSWFGFQSSGIVPDIVTMAKAMGSGMPIGACWAKGRIAAAFDAGDHGTTFGGQPLAASAALATIRELIEIDAPRRALELGNRLAGGFAGVSGISRISGAGLLRGINLDTPIAKMVGVKALEKGLIVNPIGENVIRLAPPIIVNTAEVDQAVKLIIECIEELS